MPPRSAAALAVALFAAAVGLAPTAAAAAPGFTWAPVGSATIHPGMQTVLETSGAQCTANFLFSDRAGNLYSGQASHCTSDAGELSGSGCDTTSSPLGTPVTLGNSGVSGTLAYSSWLTMQGRGEKDENTCLSNDFALIRIPPSAVGMANPSVPVFGGPSGVATGSPKPGDAVEGIGSSDLRGGYNDLSAQRGFVVTSDPSGWSHVVYLVVPGVPGDSGGGYLDAHGNALGVLVSVNSLPPAGNTLIDFGRALAYAQAHSGIRGLQLVLGTERFRG